MADYWFNVARSITDTQLHELQTCLKYIAGDNEGHRVMVYIKNRYDADRFSDIVRALGYKGNENSFDDPHIAYSIWSVMEKILGITIGEMVAILDTVNMLVGAVWSRIPIDRIINLNKRQNGLYAQIPLITFGGFMKALDGILPGYIYGRDVTREAIGMLDNQEQCINESYKCWFKGKQRTNDTKPTTDNTTVTNNNTKEEIEMENTTTKNTNPFGMNVKFGQCTDGSIIGTPLGIAVSRESADGTKSWHIYDRTTNVITDLGNIDVGGFPVFMVPTTKPAVGDLIDQDGQYIYVTDVLKNGIDGIDPRTGEKVSHVQKKNILGMSVYTKFISITDELLSDSNIDDDSLIMLMAMSQCGQPSDGANSFVLPMLLMRRLDGTDGTIDEKSLLRMMAFSSMGSQPNGNASMNSLLPFLFMRRELNGPAKTENDSQ